MRRSIRINKYCTDDKNNPERMGCELSKESWRPGVRKSKNAVCTGVMDFDRGIHRLTCSRRTSNLKCDFQTELDLSPAGKKDLKALDIKRKDYLTLIVMIIVLKVNVKVKVKVKIRVDIHVQHPHKINQKDNLEHYQNMKKKTKGTKKKKKKSKKLR